MKKKKFNIADIVKPDKDGDDLDTLLALITQACEAASDGILRTSYLEGFSMWWADGLEPPTAVEMATQDYFSEMDPIGQFVAEACARCDAQDKMRTEGGQLYDAYSEWCRGAGEDPKSQTAFGRRLNDMGFKRAKSGGRIWRENIRILTDFKTQNDNSPELVPAEAGAALGDF